MRSSYTPREGAFVPVRLVGPRGSVDLSGLLDTGAEDVLVSPAQIKSLGLRQVSTIWEDTPGGSLQEPVYEAHVVVNGLTIGPLQVVALAEGSGLEVVLGRAVLGHFRILFDGPGAVVDLT